MDITSAQHLKSQMPNEECMLEKDHLIKTYQVQIQRWQFTSTNLNYHQHTHVPKTRCLILSEIL